MIRHGYKCPNTIVTSFLKNTLNNSNRSLQNDFRPIHWCVFFLFTIMILLEKK